MICPRCGGCGAADPVPCPKCNGRGWYDTGIKTATHKSHHNHTVTLENFNGKDTSG